MSAMQGVFEQTRLDNGLQVVAVPVPGAELVSVVVSVDIGAADEGDCAKTHTGGAFMPRVRAWSKLREVKSAEIRQIRKNDAKPSPSKSPSASMVSR